MTEKQNRLRLAGQCNRWLSAKVIPFLKCAYCLWMP